MLKGPTEHSGMKLVNVRNEDQGRLDQQEEVSLKEVTAPHGQLNNLDDVLAHWLRPRARPKVPSVPLACPPCPIGLVVLVLTTERNGHKQLKDGALYCNCRDEPENSMGDIPELQVPL